MNNKQSKYQEDDFYGSDDHFENDEIKKVDYLSNKDLDRSIQKIAPIGYTDGLEIGKELTLQRGFNEGFKEASGISYKWSLLLGLVSSVDVFFHNNKQTMFDQESKDTSILSNLVDKINRLIKEHCSSPTIEQLKEEFLNFKDISINDTTSTSAAATTTELSTKSCKNEESDCCGNGSCEKEVENEKCEQGDDDDDDSGCCGGNTNDQGCCKSKNNKKEEETKQLEKFQFIIDKMGGQLFDELSKECVDTISSFGLDGQKMLNDCLSKNSSSSSTKKTLSIQFNNNTNTRQQQQQPPKPLY
ncbi:hypothetical protein ACTFIY_012340 [Dictyostelium cf. discoideum]